MGDAIVIVCDNVCLGVVRTTPLPEEKMRVGPWRGFMTTEYFGEALLLGR